MSQKLAVNIYTHQLFLCMKHCKREIYNTQWNIHEVTWQLVWDSRSNEMSVTMKRVLRINFKFHAKYRYKDSFMLRINLWEALQGPPDLHVTRCILFPNENNKIVLQFLNVCTLTLKVGDTQVYPWFKSWHTLGSSTTNTVKYHQDPIL